jgi:rare lipoprotein A (peptidoglycan hydrolase)
MYLTSRLRSAALAAVFISLICLLSSSLAVAQDDEVSLSSEADRLTYEILELKTRQRAAQSEREALLAELAQLDVDITAAETEMEALTAELEECQTAYNASLRTLYIRGEVTELEVLLGARELEEMWEDTTYLDRIVQSDTDALERLKAKISEVDLLKRDLRDQHTRQQRVAETLDEDFVASQIAALETRLSEVNASLRAAGGSGEERRQPVSDAPSPGWTVPAPGQLLNRVPSMPPLSDFERTGMVYSGYTTCYGEEFQGSPTASGVIFNMYDFTCAHRTLPFGTWLLVTFRGRQTIVQVNDRGPFVPGRVLDLSYGSAQSIGLDGVQWTEFEILIPRGD